MAKENNKGIIDDDVEFESSVPFPSCRGVLTLMTSLGFLNVYALRVNLSIAMVSMVNSSYNVAANNSIDQCPSDDNSTTPNYDPQTGEFPWNSKLQGLILGAFFYGYILTQIPGGRLAEKVGGKMLFGLGVLCTSVFTLLTPVAARISPGLLIAVRVLEGVGEGVTFPATHAMLAKWAPVLERSKLGSIIYAGTSLGTVLSSATSGIIAQHLGWPWIFYIFGSIGCVWFVFWHFLIYNSPADHPRISTAERTMIEHSIGYTDDKVPPVPWKSIFTSVPFWALMIVHFCHNWNFYTLLTTLPTYMSEILHFDITQNGILSALPYLATWLIMTSTGQITDYVRKKQILSTTNVRKLCNGIGLCVPAVCLVFVGFIGCDRYLAVGLIVAASGFDGMTMSGFGINHIDIGPAFAGTLMGLTNSFATIPGFLGPQVVGILTNNQPTLARWRIVFMISAGLCVFGSIVFALFGSGRLQPWGHGNTLKSCDTSVNSSPDLKPLLEDSESED